MSEVMKKQKNNLRSARWFDPDDQEHLDIDQE